MNNLNLLFECKDECKTILDTSHIKEMMRFTAEAVDDADWAKLCRRDTSKQVDGMGCSDSAYQNLTARIEPMIGAVTDLALQSMINNFAKDENTYTQMRGVLGSDFSQAHPETSLIAASLNMIDPKDSDLWLNQTLNFDMTDSTFDKRQDILE